jgi:hypothetical protein
MRQIAEDGGGRVRSPSGPSALVALKGRRSFLALPSSEEAKRGRFAYTGCRRPILIATKDMFIPGQSICFGLQQDEE